MRKHSSFILVVAALGLVCAAPGVARAAGFEVVEQGGRMLGNAYAGKAALAEDASTVAFNPAGLIFFKELQTVFTLHDVRSRGDWDDRGSMGPAGPVSGGSGGNPGGNAWIPNTYVAIPINEQFAAGFGAFTTFGLKTEWGAGWQGRYHAIRSDLKTINLNASLAYLVTECFSVGGGINWQQAKADLTNAIDFGSAAFDALGAQAAAAAGFFPETNDGIVKLRADDTSSWGWNLGFIWEPVKGTRVGVAYRSQVHHELTGHAHFKVPPIAVPLTGMGRFTNSRAKARVTLPDQLAVSASHELTDVVTLLADVNWTNWSKFKELTVKFKNPAEPTQTTPENWKDAFRFSVGALYELTEQVMLRCGLAWDQSPIPSRFRTVRIPTNSRVWASLGIGFKVTEKVALDIAWMHVWIRDGRVTSTSATQQTLRGRVQSSADVFGFQITIDL